MPNWTRDQLLAALNLYHRTPFGRQHKTYPPIVELAALMGRTPSALTNEISAFQIISISAFSPFSPTLSSNAPSSKPKAAGSPYQKKSPGFKNDCATQGNGFWDPNVII